MNFEPLAKLRTLSKFCVPKIFENSDPWEKKKNVVLLKLAKLRPESKFCPQKNIWNLDTVLLRELSKIIFIFFPNFFFFFFAFCFHCFLKNTTYPLKMIMIILQNSVNETVSIWLWIQITRGCRLRLFIVITTIASTQR